MDLNKTLKDLEAQHATKLQQISQIEQALNKAQTERIKIEGAYEVTKMLLEEENNPTTKEDASRAEESTGDTVGKLDAE